MPFIIRPAVVADAEAAAEVLRRSIREVCGPDYGHDAPLLERWCGNKTRENLERWISDPENVMLVAEQGARLLAVGAIHCSGEIRLCYAVPEALGRGIGGALLAGLESHAAGWSLERITLHSTSTAKGFYERHGYRQNGEPASHGPGFAYPMLKTLAPLEAA